MKSIFFTIFALALFSFAGISAVQAQGLEKSGGYVKSQSQQEANLVSTSVVINEVYGGAGCGAAGCSTYDRDFIELKNISAGLVNIGGWSVQYASATGTAWQVTTIPAGTTLRPGDTYLIGESTGAAGTGVNPLPTPNVSGTIAMSATAAKIALVNTNVALSGACPTGNATIVDFVSYGATANCAEDPTGTTSGSSTLLAVAGNGAPSPSTTTSIQRAAAGTDTDNNDVDFTTAAPTPVASLQPTAATATFAGRVVNSTGSGISNAMVTVTDAGGAARSYQTNGFGYFNFDEMRTGETYTVSVSSKQYQFNPSTQAITLNEDLRDFEFRAEP